MRLKLIAILLSSLIIMSCGMPMPSVKRASHNRSRDISKIDDLILREKRSFIDKCFQPVRIKEIPETVCQTRFFDLLERRYHRNPSYKQLLMAADDFFFGSHIRKDIKSLVSKDPFVRSKVKSAFISLEEMLEYYEMKYSFSK